MTAPRCPECAQGKHVNCTGTALDERTDELVVCRCPDPHCFDGLHTVEPGA